MTWEPRPVPEVTPESEPYWTGAAEEKLLLRDCQNCGLVYHYPRTLCPDCFSEDVEWREAAGTGEVYSYSVARTMDGWPEEDIPLVIGYVELDEGPRVMTNIRADPVTVEVGSRVKVAFVDTETEESIAVPVFVLNE